jgi:hypothetical protein
MPSTGSSSVSVFHSRCSTLISPSRLRHLPTHTIGKYLTHTHTHTHTPGAQSTTKPAAASTLLTAQPSYRQYIYRGDYRGVHTDLLQGTHPPRSHTTCRQWACTRRSSHRQAWSRRRTPARAAQTVRARAHRPRVSTHGRRRAEHIRVSSSARLKGTALHREQSAEWLTRVRAGFLPACPAPHMWP